jgi:TolB protein
MAIERAALGLLCVVAIGAAPTPDRVTVQDLSWSSDGGSLFFSAMRTKLDYSDYKPERWSVYRYDFATKQVRRFLDRALWVAAEPGGQRLAVGRLVGGQRDIHLFDLEGRELAKLTDHPADDFAATWSPDGRRLAFGSTRDGKVEMYTVGSDGANLKRLTDSGGESANNPTWSPDGKRIAYYLEKGDGKDQVQVVNPDGSGVVAVTRDERNNIFPGWTPDGRILFASSVKGEKARLFTVALDGSDRQPLLGLESFYGRYSPDGTRLAYIGEGAILVVDAAGERLTEISLSGIE